MPRSNRCRWILPFSTRLIPLPSPRLESIEMEFVEIFSFFSYHRFSSFFLLIIRIPSSNNFIIFRNKTFVFSRNAIFDLHKLRDYLAFQNWRDEWKRSKAGGERDYRRKRRISTLSRSRSFDLGIIDINKMYEDAWNLRQHTLMSTVERFIVSSMPR